MLDGKRNARLGATGETFARWRLRVRAEVLDELRKVLDGDRRRWPDPRKRDLGKPERRKRPRAGVFIRTRDAHLEHEKAKAELKSLVPQDAQQAMGHGILAKRSKSGAVIFELLKAEDDHATVE